MDLHPCLMFWLLVIDCSAGCVDGQSSDQKVEVDAMFWS